MGISRETINPTNILITIAIALVGFNLKETYDHTKLLTAVITRDTTQEAVLVELKLHQTQLDAELQALKLKLAVHIGEDQRSFKAAPEDKQ